MPILQSFTQMMNLNANVNFYMFHGGTNFGFSNGKNDLQKFILILESPCSEIFSSSLKYNETY